MFWAVAISALAMSAIVALRYWASSGFFAWVTERRMPGRYGALKPQIRREMGWSLVSALVYGVPAGIVAWGWEERGWTRIYEDIGAYPLWYLPVSLVIYLFLHDTWFYWTHRAMHDPRLFRRMHAVHHASRPPTAWAAMSFHPSEALTGAIVIPVLVFLVPIHIAVLGLVLAIMTLMGVTNHMGWEMFPRRLVHSRLGGWLITASHHQRHHEHYLCNYGLYFRFWDRLCGTDKGLSDKLTEQTG
ncbi:sterol desaturase family protein [Qipengyuania atrilutea]|uniref:Sterol desaturase family protein n=1 Tax=Qipengyuania atrilutea TaxID=2744473 RepID=A0A850H3T6_9SPHN|nr:sterol desaturase family protein [Actirhodobacter atriluteus]NVD44533.1 sterol desaturase family protein [Actirhodobacter atriluteus]